MTPGQTRLVVHSWNRCDKINVVTQLYTQLFEDHPALEQIFLGDKTALVQKFIDTLELIVTALAQPEETSVNLYGRLRALGEQHIAYGVHQRHYQLVEDSLISALQSELGSSFGSEEQVAWQAAYRNIASVMLSTGPVSD